MILEQRRRRATGTIITVERDPEDLELEDGARYITACERHATTCEYQTLELARRWAAWPIWCEECQDIMVERGLL